MTRLPRRTRMRLTPYGKEPDLKDPGSDVYAPRAPKAKKNLKEFCRGNPNTPHALRLKFWPRTERYKCRWEQWRYRDGGYTGAYHYRCYHREECSRCGKVTIAYVKPEQCPLFKPKPEPGQP